MADFSTLPPHLRSAYAQDPRYRRSQAMGRQAAGIQDIRHPLQGLAQMLMAYKSGEAQRGLESEYAEKGAGYSKALAEALQKIQPSTETIPAAGPPALGGEMPTVTRDVPGDYSAAANIMSQAGAPDLAMQFAMTGAQREQSLRDLESERAYEEGRFRTEKEIEQEFAPTKERATIKGADGRQYYKDTGKPVLPGVKTPQETFLQMLEPPAPDPAAAAVPEPVAGVDPFDTTILGVPEDAELAAGTFSPEDGQQPSVRDIFNSLPQEAQIGIKTSQDPMKAFSSYLLKSKGMDIQFNPDGTISSISQGGAGEGWGKKTTGTIEEKLFNTREGLARLQTIEDQMKPEYFEVGTRLSNAFSAAKESMGINLSPEDQVELEDYSVFQMNALDNINRGIKEMTGAQMSQAEAGRLRKGMPDPGENWWSGDSPTQFKGKLGSKIKVLRSAGARYQYALKKGWDMDPENLAKALPLNKVEDLIEERGVALERQIRARQPNLSDAAIEGFVMQTLNSEFGMGQ